MPATSRPLEYEDGNTGKRPFTQLFTLSDDHLDDGDGGFQVDKTAAAPDAAW